MVSNIERVLRHQLRKLARLWQEGQVVEEVGAGEQVVTIVRKEGEEMQPTDTRCQAESSAGRRCKNEIIFDMEIKAWSRFCEKHSAQDAKAREEGKPRVKKFEAPESEEG